MAAKNDLSGAGASERDVINERSVRFRANVFAVFRALGLEVVEPIETNQSGVRLGLSETAG